MTLPLNWQSQTSPIKKKSRKVTINISTLLLRQSVWTVISYLDAFDSAEKIIIPLGIFPVYSDVLWTRHREIPAKEHTLSEWSDIFQGKSAKARCLTCTEGSCWPVRFSLSCSARRLPGCFARWPWEGQSSHSNQCALLLNGKNRHMRKI